MYFSLLVISSQCGRKHTSQWHVNQCEAMCSSLDCTFLWRVNNGEKWNHSVKNEKFKEGILKGFERCVKEWNFLRILMTVIKLCTLMSPNLLSVKVWLSGSQSWTSPQTLPLTYLILPTQVPSEPLNMLSTQERLRPIFCHFCWCLSISRGNCGFGEKEIGEGFLMTSEPWGKPPWSLLSWDGTRPPGPRSALLNRRALFSGSELGQS